MKYLNIKDVAEIFGVNRYSVKRWIEAGMIPAIKINGRLYIDSQDVATFIQNHEVR